MERDQTVANHSTTTTSAQAYGFHPLSAAFPLMEGGEFEQLTADIRAHGLQQPITIHEDQILDGRNRERACRAAGVEPHYEPFRGDDPLAFVISANIHRRHLTPEQKRGIIAKLLTAQPEKSNLQIAKQVKADDKTVASVRREMEARSEIPNVSTRIDTKGRKQPATKLKQPTEAQKRAEIEVMKQLADMAVESDLQRAITVLIREAKRAVRFENVLPADLVYPKGALGDVITRLKWLEETMVKRRGQTRRPKAKAKATSVKAAKARYKTKRQKPAG
jgi:ParB-like chromosome segregation protein Spo0J